MEFRIFFDTYVRKKVRFPKNFDEKRKPAADSPRTLFFVLFLMPQLLAGHLSFLSLDHFLDHIAADRTILSRG